MVKQLTRHRGTGPPFFFSKKQRFKELRIKSELIPDTLSLIDIGNLFVCNENRYINFGRFVKDDEL